MPAKRLVGYYESWATYRPANGKFNVEDIDPNIFTHLIYCFVNTDSDGEVVILDPWNDIQNHAIRNFNNLKNRNRQLKTLISMGGAKVPSEAFSKIASTEWLRNKFADNVVKFVGDYGFDGFDLDWEYPTNKGDFSSLLCTLSTKLHADSFIFTTAVAAGQEKIDGCYNAKDLAKYCDFINVMTYDYHGSWDNETGHNAPLYSGSADRTHYQRTLNVDSTINHWIQKGVPASKLNLGMATYGRTFTLSNPSHHGVGAPASGAGNPGPYTREAGVLSYKEICEQINARRWTIYKLDHQKVPHGVAGNQWLSFDDTDSIAVKVKYIKDKGLGGAMVWSVDNDQFESIIRKIFEILY